MTRWAEYLDAYGLTIKQAKLFEALLDGEMHSVDHLLSEVWGQGHAACAHLVPVHIGRLRKRIEPFGFRIAPSARNGGYRLYRADGLPLSSVLYQTAGPPLMAVAS